MSVEAKTEVLNASCVDIARVHSLCEAIEPAIRSVLDDLNVPKVRCGPTTDLFIKVADVIAPDIIITPIESLYIEPGGRDAHHIASLTKHLMGSHNLTVDNAYSYLSYLLAVKNNKFAGTERITSMQGSMLEAIRDTRPDICSSKTVISHIFAQVGLSDNSQVYVDLNAWQFDKQKFGYISMWTSNEELNALGIYPISPTKPFASTTVDKLDYLCNQVLTRLDHSSTTS